MAQALTLKFAQQLLRISDGASPEVFVAPCGFTSLNLGVSVETNTTNIPDCDDPDLPAWLVSDEVSKQMTVGGSGVLDTTAMQLWREWLLAGGERNVQWFTEGSAAEGGGTFEAPGILTSYEETGERGQRWQVSVEIALNGKPVWTEAV